jgi:inner membrane protein
VVSFVGPVEYVLSHRGVTHSLLLLPAWALLYSWILAKLLREPGGWRALYGVTTLALGAHIAGDLITSFGTMIFAPFSDWRAGIGTTFIIDLWFSAIILAGLGFSILFRKTRLPAVVASVVLCGYVAFQYVQKQRALEFGVEYAKSQALRDAKVTVHPRPVSPFNWTVFVSDDEAHRFAHVNLVRKDARRFQPGDGFIARLDSPYLPLEQAVWVTRRRYGETEKDLIRGAWNSEPLAFFRWFADLPAFDGMSKGCVWFTDLRFLTPGRETMPFRYGVCPEPEGWRFTS